MRNRTPYYISRKSVLTWLMAICMVASAVARIGINGLKGSDDPLYLWCQIILPVAATLLYVVIALFNGKEMFYKTALPVWMIAIYSGIWISANIPSTMLDWLFWIALIFFAFMYQEITDGRYNSLLLIPVVLSPVCFILYYYRYPLMTRNWDEILPIVPDLLMLLGVFLLTFGIRIHADGKYHPTWGDRSDGRRVRTLSPMAQRWSEIPVPTSSKNPLRSAMWSATSARSAGKA